MSGLEEAIANPEFRVLNAYWGVEEKGCEHHFAAKRLSAKTGLSGVAES